VAGRFYPADPEALGKMVSALLFCVPAKVPERAVALMAPHAGFMYSGRVAGETYAQVAIPHRAILLGPNHTGLGEALSIWDGGGWRLPGGVVEVDEDLCGRLKQQCPLLVSDQQAHLREHCLEVQIPFLQGRVDPLRIVPVVIGTSRLEDLRNLGLAVARAVQETGEEVLIVISSDMTHYEPAEVAASKDRIALDRLERLDAEGLHRTVRTEKITMCGFAPSVVGLIAARELGAQSGRLVLYAHSGEVTGDYDNVVGYAGMVFS